jgi:phage/plasmid-like protein (TIGR03299 family)
MAHEVYQFENGDYSLAFVGETPWHDLGQQIDPDSPLEVWAKKAHLDWGIDEAAAAYFHPKTGNAAVIPNRKVLFRNDTNEYLSIVGNKYHPVQPREVLEFFRDLIETGGFRMHTAGSLFNGRRLWALAEIGQSATIMGQDRINGYLLLAIACDGTLANTGQFTSVRVVCNNTLEMSISGDRYVKLPHSREFNPEEMKIQLGLASEVFSNFIGNTNELAKRKMKYEAAVEFFVNLYRTPKEIEEGVVNVDAPVKTHVKTLLKLYENEELRSSKNTAWGLVNAVTRYYDHERRATSTDHRINNAWFGDGSNMKKKAWDQALKLAA